MRLRIRQHVNPLGVGFEKLQSDLPALVPGRPVEVEVGCAEAQFLFERARLAPEHNYVGLEIREELVGAVNVEAQERNSPVQAIFCHANHHLTALFDPATVDRVFLNFPDPWFKRRHHKRRLIDEDLADKIGIVLKPGGELFFQSDVWSLALEALDIFERLDTSFCNRAGSWSFWKDGNPYGVRSGREQHCERDGLPVWRIWYSRS